MTKIFEALQKGQGAISEMLRQVLEEQDAVLREPIPPEVTTEAEVRAVLGDSGPIQPLLSPKTANGISQTSVRQVPIRIPASTPLLPFDNTNFSAAEQYRMIRTKLIQHPRQPRLILISSAVPGDGKSVTAVNIAGALALKTEANVLLVDTDFRRSTIHMQLGLPASPGLSEVLTGIVSVEEALVQTAQFPNLYVIP